MAKRLRFLAACALVGSATGVAIQRARAEKRRHPDQSIEVPTEPEQHDHESGVLTAARVGTSYRRKAGIALALTGLLAAGIVTTAYAANWHHHNSWRGDSHDRRGTTSQTDTTVGVSTTDSTITAATTKTHHFRKTRFTPTDPTTTQTTPVVTTSTTPAPPQTAPPPPTTTTTAPVTPTSYPLHTGITATVFWVGEPKGNGSSEDNSVSAYDDAWEAHYGGYDNYAITRVPPTYANGLGFTPLQNPFYLDLPYDDINNQTAFHDRCSVVPWATEYSAASCTDPGFSYMKNRWVEIQHTVNGVTYTAYGQIEDAGPYVYDDEAYVFGTNDARPASQQANNAGLDVSPALRDYLHFGGTDAQDQLNNDENEVNWRFVTADQVPTGPWSAVITTSQVYQP